VQTAQVVKVLMSMESGTIGSMRGKSLYEIDVRDVVAAVKAIAGYDTASYLPSMCVNVRHDLKKPVKNLVKNGKSLSF